MGKFNFGDAPENEENKESASENNESETSATSKFSFGDTYNQGNATPEFYKSERLPDWAIAAGAGAGAYGAHRGWGKNWFKGDPELYSTKKINTGSDHEIFSVKEPGPSVTENVIESMQEKLPGVSGSSRQFTQNFNSNRQGIINKNMTPSEEKFISKSPRMVTMNKHNIQIPESVAYEIEEDQRKVNKERMKSSETQAKIKIVTEVLKRMGFAGAGAGYATEMFNQLYHDFDKFGWDDQNIANAIGAVGGLSMIRAPNLPGAAAVIGSAVWPEIRKPVRKFFGYKDEEPPKQGGLQYEAYKSYKPTAEQVDEGSERMLQQNFP